MASNTAPVNEMTESRQTESWDLPCPDDFEVDAHLLQAIKTWTDSQEQAEALAPAQAPPVTQEAEEPARDTGDRRVSQLAPEPDLFEIEEAELLAQLDEEFPEERPMDYSSTDDRLEAILKIDGGAYRGYVTSYDDCLALEAAYLRRQDKSAAFLEGTTCADFPETVEQQRACVEELFHAMKNMEGIVDCGRWVPRKGPDGKVLKVDGKPTAEKVLEPAAVAERVAKLRGVEVELLAWNLLMVTRDAQLGRLAVGSWTGGITYQKFSCWRDRFDCVLAACRESKAIVMDLTDHQWILRVARSPAVETKRKVCNRQINVKRHGESMRGRMSMRDQSLGELPPPVENPALEAATARLKTRKRSREETAGDDEGVTKKQKRTTPATPSLPTPPSSSPDSPSSSPPSSASSARAIEQLRVHMYQRGQMTYEQMRAQCGRPRMV